jgi:hypothetical protein
LLFVFKGQAELEIEGKHTQLSEPAILVLPPLSVHGYRFSEDVEGFVVTLAAPLIAHLQAQLGIRGMRWPRPRATRRAKTASTSTACFRPCKPNTRGTNRRGKC